MSRIKARFQLKLASFELNAELELSATGITVISGASGSGKTLLMRCIAGLEQPQLGFCQVNGELWQDSSIGYYLAPYQRSLGYVFQEACLFPHLTVQENIHYGRKRVHSTAAISLGQLLALLDIGHLLKRKPDKLSGGEKQRVAIARALAVNPQVLLMDEPLAALDPVHKQEILPYLRSLQQALHLPMVYITHSSQEMTQLADYLVLMEKGRILASGELQSVLTRLDLPLAQSQRASSVLIAEVLAYNPEFQLLELRFSGGRLSVPHSPLSKGSQFRLRIDAHDVSLSLEPPTANEPFNRLQARVLASVDTKIGYTTFSLQVGNERLLAQVSRKQASLLKLEVGQKVYAEIRNAAILN